MKRVLIVSPHFPPVNAPDMQRVRLALPYLRELGWEPVVLALDPGSIEGAVLDPLLEQTYPSDIRVVRVRGVPPAATRWAGIGNLWLRVGRAYQKTGDALLARERFDLVFISTTQFTAFKLGPRWKRKFGVPFVLDYQDPWINPYYARTATRPPGGRLKFALSQWTARRIEPVALREAAAVIAVSEAYGRDLAETYPWFDPAAVKLLPFGAAPQDFVVAAKHRPAAPLVNFDDGLRHLVYTGRCGPDMTFAMSALFRAFQLYLTSHPEEARQIRFHFIGTDYSPPPLGREWAMPIAREQGVAEFVHEHCYRVPYFDALYYLQRAEALIGVGSNDPTYAASKIFPYILARRPMLLIYHRESLVLRCARSVSAGTMFEFGPRPDVDALGALVHDQWFASPTKPSSSFDEAAFDRFTAGALAAELAGVFREACARSSATSLP